jgi:hypothetical protein
MRCMIAIVAAMAVGSPAAAKVVLVAPDECLAPADAPPYVPEEDIEARDLNPHRAVADDVFLLFEQPLDDDLFARFPYDARLLAAPNAEELCGAAGADSMRD